MKILVLNCGSSSIKYQVFDMQNEDVLAIGLVEKIGLSEAYITHKPAGKDKVKVVEEIADHTKGIEEVFKMILDSDHGVIGDIKEIEAVGHRVVHGEEKFCGSVLITDEVVAKLEECTDLAPLHNPQNLKGIYAIKKLIPNVPQVGVFDTAFHQTMPAYSYMYAIPYSLYSEHKIRRYGFHGTSHRFISEAAVKELGLDPENSKIITCHLGNGASVAAVKNGKSLDTSMGLTPVEGLMMGTRCGDLDLGAMLHIMNVKDLNTTGINNLINKESGLLGVSGISSDMRDIEDAIEKGDERAKLSLEMYAYRVKKYIGSYAAAMGGVDAVVFAGGVGENAPEMREDICKDFEFLGLEFDSEKNAGKRGKTVEISKDSSRVKVIVIPTNEELVIAEDTYEIVKGMQ